MAELMEILNYVYSCDVRSDALDKKGIIDKAISEIKSLIKRKLKKRPELASMKQGMTCSQCGQNYHSEDIGFNLALTEIEKRLEAL